MDKKILIWRVSELEQRHATINFPEYQREPSVWSRAAKQRLVDSMLRRFDIASLYFYENEDGSFDCVDGRQRIGAIMSFLGRNPADEDNGFDLKVSNEIYVDDHLPFHELEGIGYEQARERSMDKDKIAQRLVDEFDKYKLTIVQLSGSLRPEEFNLQFTRLNLGTIINSGEKLHAMVGEIRDVCFEDGGLGQHPFLEMIKIPTRRYSKEQVAAQILAQAFARKETGEYTKTRHFDLQRFFKAHSTLDDERQGWVQEITATLHLLANVFKDLSIIRSRAITVSTVLFAWMVQLDEAEAKVYAAFVKEFLWRLKWQVQKGLDVDPEYRYLIDFQRHVTQASVEKPAVQARAEVLAAGFDFWKGKGRITGDEEYSARTKSNPVKECRKRI